MVQGREDTNRREKSRSDVTDRGADTHRWSLRFTRNADNTAHALDNHVISPLLRIGTGMPKAGTRCINERRMLGFQRLVIQAQILHRSRTEILDENVGLFQQLLEDGTSTISFKVECHAPLPTIHTHEVEAEPVFKGTKIARFIPCTGLLNLDDLCPKITKKHRRIRTRENPREIQNLYTVKWACHLSSPLSNGSLTLQLFADDEAIRLAILLARFGDDRLW